MCKALSWLDCTSDCELKDKFVFRRGERCLAFRLSGFDFVDAIFHLQTRTFVPVIITDISWFKMDSLCVDDEILWRMWQRGDQRVPSPCEIEEFVRRSYQDGRLDSRMVHVLRPLYRAGIRRISNGHH